MAVLHGCERELNLHGEFGGSKLAMFDCRRVTKIGAGLKVDHRQKCYRTRKSRDKHKGHLPTRIRLISS
jgi:hypothetical protein